MQFHYNPVKADLWLLKMWGAIWVEFDLKYKMFLSRKCIWKHHLQMVVIFVQVSVFLTTTHQPLPFGSQSVLWPKLSPIWQEIGWCLVELAVIGSQIVTVYTVVIASGGRFKNTYELLNLRALKCSPVNKIHIFQCMGKMFCVEFQRYPLKFHTKYLSHTLKDMIFIQHWNFKSS